MGTETPRENSQHSFNRIDTASTLDFAVTKEDVPVRTYGGRVGYTPRAPAQFGDGGAFPEIHLIQYPRCFHLEKLSTDPYLGKTNSAEATPSVGETGENKSRNNTAQGLTEQEVSRHARLTHNPFHALERPSGKDTETALEKTKSAISARIDQKSVFPRPAVSIRTSESEYIKYTPATQASGHQLGATERLIKMHKAQNDPLEPPRFRHKKVPRGPGASPVPIMQSPPRSIDASEQDDWKIPPSISNWKNPKGYTIPLDKRLAADGRGLQEVQINDNFAKLSEALYLAEHKAREAVGTRADIQRKLLHTAKQAKEAELRILAKQARVDRVGLNVDENITNKYEVSHSLEEVSLKQQDSRDFLRDERKRARERERRLDVGGAHDRKKKLLARDRDRDVSEQIALGNANVQQTSNDRQSYDQRLFDKQHGVTSGFHNEDAFDVYDEPIFQHGSKTHGSGALSTSTKDTQTGLRAVEFKHQASARNDPFGLDTILTEVKKT